MTSAVHSRLKRTEELVIGICACFAKHVSKAVRGERENGGYLHVTVHKGIEHLNEIDCRTKCRAAEFRSYCGSKICSLIVGKV